MTTLDATSRWGTVLDDYEARLAAVDEASATGNPAAVPPFIPPSDLGPMPDGVVARARELLVRSRGLELHLAAQRDRIAERLRAVPSGPAPAPRPARLDLAL